MSERAPPGTYGHLTLNANGSFTYAADITAAIDSAAQGSAPVDTFTYSELDGHGGTATQNVSFTVERPPVVDLNGATAGTNATASFTEQTQLAIAPSATITNQDASTLTSLTATLTARPDGNGVESLSLNSAAAALAATDTLTVGYTAATGVLSISGTASTADYQSILDGIVYNDSSDDPNTADRTVNVVATNSASETSTTSSVDISITRVNDAPVNHVPGTQVFNEDTPRVFNSANGNLITITDPDVESGNETVTLAVAHGTLTLGSTSGLASNSGNGTNNVTFSGTLANVNNALNGLTFAAAANFNGSDTLTITTSDNGNTGTPGPQQNVDPVTLAVSAVNDAPVVANGTSVALLATDEDNPSAPVSMNSLFEPLRRYPTIRRRAAARRRTIWPAGGHGRRRDRWAGYVAILDRQRGQLDLVFVASAITTASALLLAATDQIRFLPAANFNGTPGSLTVHLVDNSAGTISTGGRADVSATGSSTPYSTGTITIGETVNAVDDAPVFTLLDNPPCFTEGGSAVVLGDNATVHDVKLDALNGGTGNTTGRR